MIRHQKPTWPLLIFPLACAFAFSTCTSSQSGQPTAGAAVSPVSAHAGRAEAVQVPEGYTVEVVAGPELVAYPMFGTVDETGRLFLFESTGNVYDKSQEAIDNPQFRINLLEDLNGDGIYDKSTIFADKVGFPQGGVFYKGSLYASSAPDLLKLTDTNGDGVADKREVLLSGWILNVNANSLVGPFMGPDGWLYLTNAIMGFDVTTQEGERLKGETSRLWRLRPDGSGLEWVSAGGMNNPVELTFTEAGEPIGTMTYFTDPKAGQRDALIYWTEGGVYPKPNNNITRDQLPRTGELLPVVAKYSRVSPAGISRYRGTGLGNEFQGNLFSAQFNTHRIIRHKLVREGASFRTEDEVFFKVDHQDFHPTDVLEDGDGSLLVVETGGWFIKGCPLSQVSKPELKGAIYRVRRQGAPKVADPFGNQIKWASLQAMQGAALLEERRPFVQDRAGQWLVDQGVAALGPLTELLRKSASADARTRAVFALSRIGTPEALAGVRTGLADPDLQVRVAAARGAGLAMDRQAVSKLQELVRQDEPAVRRQAATALGQIGEAQAVPALLAAAEGNQDRFVEHALIYALLKINQPEQVAHGLTHPSPEVRKVALVALDQMPSAPLQVGQLTPFLTSDNLDLQRTGLWVAAHHPEWAGEMISFLRGRFQKTSWTDEEKGLYENLLVSFCGNPGMQDFMASQLKGARPERKLFLLDAMAGCREKTFPPAWVEQVGQQLDSGSDPQVQARALELVRLRGLKTLAPRLRQVADNGKNAPSLRMEAVGALLEAEPQLTPKQFTFLYGQLQEQHEAPRRQQAATVLAQAQLTGEQQLKLAKDFLPRADAFILPRLVPVFAACTNAPVGQALASALYGSPSLDAFSEEYLQTVFAKYPSEVQPAVEQLLAKLREVKAGRLERLQAIEGQLAKGDLERGRVLYFGKAICSTCHTLGPEGGKLGPDLTSIQRDRSAHDLLEAIVYPSATFVREYETYRVRTKSGEYTGIIKKQSPDALILGTSPQTSVRLARTDIVSMEVLDVSMMPQGLDQLLNPQEMADLMAFLLGQDQDPERDQSILR
jgi:putative membrane-bound dehydrogenase-like protein